jgi:transcriptional regulator with GAF, ATPase, and Fis domain
MPCSAAINLRILLAATNGDPWKLISEKRGRSDLDYRLNVFPMRDRSEQIPLLVRDRG